MPIAPSVRLVICNSMVRHELAAGEYNLRRAECERGVALLKAALPAIRALRDVSFAELTAHAALLPELTLRRCRHIVTENERVERAGAALDAGRVEEFGRLMNASHVSMRDDYEISCRELDILVELAWRVEGVLGSRMTGGGFGGCTVSMVRADAVDRFRAERRGRLCRGDRDHAAKSSSARPGDGVGVVAVDAPRTRADDAVRGNLRTAASTRSRANGCWCRRSAPSAPGRGRSSGRRGPPRFATTPTAISAPAIGARTATSTPTIPHTLRLRQRLPGPARRRRRRAVDQGGLIVAEAESGLCQVVCFSPRHDLTLARMTTEEIERVVEVWTEQYRELGGLKAISWVQIFENRGAMMGASNPHPHCQIWACREPAQRAGEGIGFADRLPRRTRRLPAVRLSEARARRRRADRLRERAFRRVGAVLGGVAVRDVAAAASALRRFR